MKKTISLLCLLVCAVVACAGCSRGDTFIGKIYDSGEAAVVSVELLLTDREIEISASEDGIVHIDYYDSQKEYLTIDVSDNGVLTVKQQYNKTWIDHIGVKPSAAYRKVGIRIPSLETLTVATTNEDIGLTELSVDRVTLRDNGGSILCTRIDVGRSIDFTAKNGSITGTILGGWDDFSIACTVKKGQCNLPANKEGGHKSLIADCNNGDIRLEFVR